MFIQPYERTWILISIPIFTCSFTTSKTSAESTCKMSANKFIHAIQWNSYELKQMQKDNNKTTQTKCDSVSFWLNLQRTIYGILVFIYNSLTSFSIWRCCCIISSSWFISKLSTPVSIVRLNWCSIFIFRIRAQAVFINIH